MGDPRNIYIVRTKDLGKVGKALEGIKVEYGRLSAPPFELLIMSMKDAAEINDCLKKEGIDVGPLKESSIASK